MRSKALAKSSDASSCDLLTIVSGTAPAPCEGKKPDENGGAAASGMRSRPRATKQDTLVVVDAAYAAEAAPTTGVVKPRNVVKCRTQTRSADTFPRQRRHVFSPDRHAERKIRQQ